MSVSAALSRLAASLARRAELASTRFPVAALLIVALSLLANTEVAGLQLLPNEVLGWWIAGGCAAVVASILVRLALEARGSGGAVLLLGPFLAALLVGLVVRYAQSLGVFAPPLLAALTLAIPLAPYFRRPDDRRFWTFTLWTAVGVTLAFLSVLLFTLGLSAILEMIRFLFEVGLGPRAYEHIYTTALTLVGPLMALGRIPAQFDEAVEPSGDDRMVQGVHVLIDWVAAPLALATAIVLHLYAAKILVLGILPLNEVGWIVTLYAILVLALRIAADPFLAGGALFARGFARAWAPMLVVPLILLGIAIAQRVGSDGWTLERYYLALGALASGTVVTAEIVPRLRRRIRLMAAVPLLLLILSSFGPLGVADTVGRSQAARASAILDGSNLDGVRAAELRSRIGALAEVDELGRLVDRVPDAQRNDVDAAIRSGAADAESRVLMALGADRLAAQPPERPMTRVFDATDRRPMTVTGYDLALPMTEIRARTGGVRDLGVDASDLAVSLDGEDLVITVAGSTDRFAMTPLLDELPPSAGTASGSEPVEVVLISPSGGQVRLQVQGLVRPADRAAPVGLTATILLRRADWPASHLFGGDAESGVSEPGGAVGERAR